MQQSELYEAARRRKYKDGTTGTEYRLVQVGDKFQCAVDRKGIIWIPQPTDEVTDELIELWLEGDLSMGIRKDGNVVWQQRKQRFPRSKLVASKPNV